jgi:hypothetical protein
MTLDRLKCLPRASTTAKVILILALTTLCCNCLVIWQCPFYWSVSSVKEGLGCPGQYGNPSTVCPR